MDIVERLSVADVSGATLVASEHVHRYALASRFFAGRRVVDLCCGVGYGTEILANEANEVIGVDVDAGAIETARQTFGDRPDVRFEVADATQWLGSADADSVEAIVCFEGLEHLPDLAGALDQLQVLAARGTQMVLSVPNSETFGEDNEFHVTDFGPESVAALAARFDDVTVVHQFLAEGSIILRGENPLPEQARVVLGERAEGAYANHFLLLVNVAESPDKILPESKLELSVAPQFNRWARHIERANQELWVTNARLARGQRGTFDAAAASLMDNAERAEERVAQAEERYWAMHLEAKTNRERAEVLERELHEARRDAEVQLQRLTVLRNRKVVRAALGIARLIPRNGRPA